MTLRSARLRAGMSREALAYHSGLTWSAIAQIESGRRQEVRLSSLRALAEALSVSVDYLVCGPEAVGTKLFEHGLLLYGSDDDLVSSAAPFLAEGVARSDVALAVAPRPRLKVLREALGTDAGNVEFVDSADWYRSPREALMRYRAFVAEKFAQGAPWVRIVGEPPAATTTAKQTREWTRYEAVVDVVFRPTPSTIVCLYDTRTAARGVVAGVRQTHPHLTTEGDVRAANPDYQAPDGGLVEGAGPAL
ncbi:MAG: hypothetical protein QOF60_1574 [Actinomycetota bacterium]|nr:hypothetical protein [Actinomycetota bacterium]